MPILITCSTCNKSLHVPDNALGKKVKCPLCQAIIVAAVRPASGSAPLVADVLPPAPPKPAAVTAKPPSPASSPPRDKVRTERPGGPAQPPRQDRRRERDVDDRDERSYPPLSFKVVVNKDPDKKLKGQVAATLTEKGLELKQGKKNWFVPVDSDVRYVKGHVFSVPIDDRQVELAIFSFTHYKERLARETARFLRGERGPLDPDKYRLPWYLYLPAALPLGIPVITMGGAIWGGLGGGLAAGCVAVAQRDRWSVGTRIGVMMGMVVAGYLTLFGALVATGKLAFSRQPVAMVDDKFDKEWQEKFNPFKEHDHFPNVDPFPPVQAPPKKEEPPAPPPNVPDAQGRVFLPGDAIAVAFLRDEPQTLVTASGSGVRLWDTAAAKEIAAIPQEGTGQEATGMAVSPNGAKAILIRHGGAVIPIDLRGRQVEPLWQKPIPAQPAQWAVAWSADGSFVATANGDRSVRIFNVATGSLRFNLTGHKDQVHAVAIAPDSKTVASGDADTVYLWDGNSSQKLGSVKAQDGGGVGVLPAVWSLAFSPDGKLLAVGGNDGTIRLHDVAGKSEKLKLTHGHPVGALAFSSDGKWLASAGFGPKLMVWETASGDKRAEMNLDAQRVHGLAFQPGRNRLAISGGRITLWDVPGLQ